MYPIHVKSFKYVYYEYINLLIGTISQLDVLYPVYVLKAYKYYMQ